MSLHDSLPIETLALSLPYGATLNNTIGALLVGCFLTIFLFGIVVLQLYVYWENYGKDPLYVKLVVYSVFLAELIHTISVAHSVYETLITSFGSYAFLIDAPASLRWSVLCSAYVYAAVQSFFAWRIKVVSGQWLVPVIAWFLSLFRLAALIATVVIALRMDLLGFTLNYKFLLIITLTVGAVVDSLVAIALVYWLSKSRSGIERSDAVVKKLMFFSIESGGITSLIAISMLVTFLVHPLNYVWAGIMVTIAKVYSNSLLLSLNQRKSLRDGLTNSTAVNTGSSNRSSNMVFAKGTGRSRESRQQRRTEQEQQPPVNFIEMSRVTTSEELDTVPDRETENEKHSDSVRSDWRTASKVRRDSEDLPY